MGIYFADHSTGTIAFSQGSKKTSASLVHETW